MFYNININIKYIKLIIKQIINKIALNLFEVLRWFRKPVFILFKLIIKLLTIINTILIVPLILPFYKLYLKTKKVIKNIIFKPTIYLSFVKKYLSYVTIIIIITLVSTHNIFAQTYSTDEYASKSLLSNLITTEYEHDIQLIEEKQIINKNKSKVVNYLEEQGTLQELVIETPFIDKEYEADNTKISPDSSSLVLINPEDINLTTTNEIVNTRTDAIIYTVQTGDIIGKIAEKFNVSANTILWENNLSWRSTIKPGLKLNILPNSGINHEVKSGDTVLAIAKKYQIEAQDIVFSNKLANAGDIKKGDLLFIPGGIKPATVKSSYTSRQTITYLPPASTDSGTKLLWPLNSHRITQYYHWGHHALDVGDKTGNPIYASESGKIERSGWNKGYGYNIVINHGNGLKTLYAHASSLLVNAGETVSRGQTIALIGSTGWSTGPHIHYEVRVNGAKQNPLNYIK